MSEKERELMEKLSNLPPDIQDLFLEQLKGAVTAIEALGNVGSDN